ncbi:MAG: hypothetical protein J0M16_08550 [Gammaproteobacteria bacterium]|nr:hypothetical protein [Gammaproteobacteria bacterium]
MNLTEDMSHYIEHAFRAEDRAEAICLVANATIEDGSPASARLKRCALVGSDGSLSQLQRLTDLLRVDWRDVIMAGEYEYHRTGPVRLRDLTKPIVLVAADNAAQADGPDEPRE